MYPDRTDKCHYVFKYGGFFVGCDGAYSNLGWNQYCGAEKVKEFLNCPYCMKKIRRWWFRNGFFKRLMLRMHGR